LNAQSKNSGPGGWLHHPLAPVVIGFLLTGVVGGTLTNFYTLQRAAAERKQAQIEARTQAVTRLSALSTEQIPRAEHLLTALQSDTRGDDLDELVELYQAASIRWRSEASPALIAAREVLPADDYYRFRERVKGEFRDRFLKPLEVCITRSQDALKTGGSVSRVLDECEASQLVTQAGHCVDGLMDLLYEIAAGAIEDHDQAWIEKERERHRERLAVACASPVGRPADAAATSEGQAREDAKD
jgi:hypothetical protein